MGAIDKAGFECIATMATGGQLIFGGRGGDRFVQASANTASLPHLTARLRNVGAPTPAVIECIHESVMLSIPDTEP